MVTIEILGTGCPKCRQLAAAVEKAVTQAGIDANVEKITDIERILAYNVIATPALVVDGDVKLVGRVPSEKELIRILTG